MGAKVSTHIRSNVVGYVALIIAVMGVPMAWAVARNSIGSPQIKKNAVKNSDLADNSVGSPEVIDNSLTGNDVLESSLGLPGGPAGAQGPAGPQGPAGSSDSAAQILTKLLTVDGSTSALDADVLDGQNSSAFLGANAQAADSNLLDGLNSSDFLLAGGQAVDSDLLDGLNSTEFLSSSPGSVGPASLAALPGAGAKATSAQSIPNAGVAPQIALDTEVFDTGGLYAPPADALVAPLAGTYIISGYVNWDSADVDPDRQIVIRVNGTTVASEIVQPNASAGGTSQSVTTTARVPASGTIALFARQTSGSSLNTISGVDLGHAGLSAQWVSP